MAVRTDYLQTILLICLEIVTLHCASRSTLVSNSVCTSVLLLHLAFYRFGYLLFVFIFYFSFVLQFVIPRRLIFFCLLSSRPWTGRITAFFTWCLQLRSDLFKMSKERAHAKPSTALRGLQVSILRWILYKMCKFSSWDLRTLIAFRSPLLVTFLPTNNRYNRFMGFLDQLRSLYR